MIDDGGNGSPWRDDPMGIQRREEHETMRNLSGVAPGGCPDGDIHGRVHRARERAAREEVAPRGDADLQARFDQLEKNYTQTTRDIRNNQANLGADLGAVRDELRTLRGQVEGMNKSQNLKKQLDDLATRVGNIENSLKKGKGETDGQRSEATDEVPSAEAKTDPKDAYNACYKLFKEGQNTKAREEFQKFLKQHPKTPYSGSAQFWIAETWYVDDQIRESHRRIREGDQGVSHERQGASCPVEAGHVVPETR